MNKIKELKIKNFTCFENLEFKFNNINIFIGENGVGKTHLLKVLFSHIKSISDIKKDVSVESFSTELQEKIEDVFFGGNIKNLNRGNKHFEIEIVTENGIIKSKCGQKNSLNNNELEAELQQKDSEFNVIYIPTQEILSTYTNYLDFSEISKYKLDSTYYYLANSLNKKENKVYSLSSFYNGFNKILKGEIINTNEGYSFQKG
ncbi:AAA family ATPase, partial [Cellulophaga sp. Z1A5H]|uniref:AAA family ATPase n=1 Tax=Cellulophaga sp. Z1A5H TaxID=2687291 RepID=UPI00196A6326